MKKLLKLDKVRILMMLVPPDNVPEPLTTQPYTDFRLTNPVVLIITCYLKIHFMNFARTLYLKT